MPNNNKAWEFLLQYKSAKGWELDDIVVVEETKQKALYEAVVCVRNHFPAGTEIVSVKEF